MKIFKSTFELPFNSNIPNHIEEHIREISLFSRFLKFIKRYIFITLMLQKRKEIFSIDVSHNKILWINISAPSLGDSLMDLSSRILLKNRKVDLFTDKKNSHIYLHDDIFKNVFTNIADIKSRYYDLVILDSYSTRSVMIKSQIASKTMYVGMYGYFNGPEVNRTLFSFHRMNQLLGNPINNDQIIEIANNLISISKLDKELVNSFLPKDFVSIVLGGEWDFKTYKNWDKVIDRLTIDSPQLNILLIGSNNAIDLSEKLMIEFPNHNIQNLVGKLTFNQTVEVIGKSKITLCCDGGLLHGANAVRANVVALFARLKPEILLTKNNFCNALYSDINVNNITPDEIVNKYYTVKGLIASLSKD